MENDTGDGTLIKKERRRKIFVIDDDPFLRSTVEKMLHRIEILDVITIASGLEAIARLKEAEVLESDLIVCDLDMPGSDGMVVMRRTSEQSIKASWLLLSGKGVDVLRAAKTIGAEYGLKLLDVLPKPPSVGMLADALNKCADSGAESRSVQPISVTEADILVALEKKQFEPFFEPKINVATGVLCGCEASARWRHPEFGILPQRVYWAN